MQTNCAVLDSVFKSDIPLTHALDIRVQQWQNQQLQLKIPLAPNTNHKQTMFGGSVYCALTLAGWGWLYLRLKEALITEGEIVIHGGNVEYPAPVNSDAIVTCNPPDEAQWKKFVTLFQRRGRARLTLISEIHTATGELAARLEGQYVLYK
ncbi:YiiD C-terminal domain-containing protein [Pseudomonas sp. F1_0610]|uniref:YiiD C-terminal domain-containing protein n=1 Tax=Pseudomonas sp. F1_0610 TaxID=3114284 RepID=UPI0039C18DCC